MFTGGGSLPLCPSKNPAVPRSVAAAQVLLKAGFPDILGPEPRVEKQTRKQSATQEDVITGSNRAMFYHALHNPGTVRAGRREHESDPLPKSAPRETLLSCSEAHCRSCQDCLRMRRQTAWSMNEARRFCQDCQGRRIVPATLSCFIRELPSRENASALCPDTLLRRMQGGSRTGSCERSCSGTRNHVFVLGDPQLTGPGGRLAVESCMMPRVGP